MAHGEQQIHYFSASIPNDNYVKEEELRSYLCGAGG
jgi:hypothetical protein